MDLVYFEPEDKPYQVQIKPEKLVRRGPGEYYLIARKPDGSRSENRLMPANFAKPS